MTPYGTRLHAIADESGGHVIVAQTLRIEPVFQGSDAAVVFKWSPIPDTPKRRHFVIAGAATRSKSQAAIRANADWESVGPQFTVRIEFEVAGWCKFVVRVQRRSVASRAAFTAEDGLSSCG